MKRRRKLAILILSLASAAPVTMAQANSPQLTYVLKQMDTGSARFRRATADFQSDYYEKIVHDTTTQKGYIYFERQGNSTNMGMVIVDPSAHTKSNIVKVIQYEDGTLQMFDPGVDQITVMHEGANQSEIEAFFALGFGGSGTDLAKAWNIKDLGPETLTDNGQPVKVEKLDLQGKSPSMRKNFTHITIWIDPVRDVSLKQIFYTPAGDYRTATYSEIKVNGNVHKDHFAIKRDKNTTIVNH
ncbi:MAG: outer membrane lipoprotein-sorting protein [Acidobacteriaceae bacterium]